MSIKLLSEGKQVKGCFRRSPDKLIMQSAWLTAILCCGAQSRQAFSVPMTWRVLPYNSIMQLTQDDFIVNHLSFNFLTELQLLCISKFNIPRSIEWLSNVLKVHGFSFTLPRWPIVSINNLLSFQIRPRTAKTIEVTSDRDKETHWQRIVPLHLRNPPGTKSTAPQLTKCSLSHQKNINPEREWICMGVKMGRNWEEWRKEKLYSGYTIWEKKIHVQ